MLDQKDLQADARFLISRVAHVVERIGLAMSGAMCGTFVAAYLERASIAIFDSIGFIMSMILIGIIGFYLGIDIPRCEFLRKPCNRSARSAGRSGRTAQRDRNFPRRGGRAGIGLCDRA